MKLSHVGRSVMTLEFLQDMMANVQMQQAYAFMMSSFIVIEPEPSPTLAPAPVPEPVPSPVEPPAPIVTEKYLGQSFRIFQPIAANQIKPRLVGQAPRYLDYYGPDSTAVEFQAGWHWKNKGGDWIDADGVQQGPKPWAALQIKAPAWTETRFEVDVTAMLAEAQRRGISFAFLLKGAEVTDVSTRFGAHPATVVMTMADGSTRSLELLFAGSATVASPAQSKPNMSLPAFYEFETPEETPAKAVLSFYAVVKNIYSKTDAALFLLNPDKSMPEVSIGGIDGGQLDMNIASNPSIIGSHLYLDSHPQSDYIFDDPRPAHAKNIGSETSYSPEFFGGAVDTSKYPYLGAGKWLNPTPGVSVVKSYEIPHGPIAPGLGALLIDIAKDPQAVEGGFAASAGFGVSRLEMPLPADKLGRCDHLFIRQYFSWSPYEGQADSLDLSEVKAIYKGPNNTVPAWTEVGGKFGIVPTHNTILGGFSGSSGAGDGWTMRLSFGFPLTGTTTGPQMGGIHSGWHMYDFMASRHPLKLGAAGSKNPQGWGKVGGVLYARRWYCIETEMKLNSIDKPGILPDGSPHLINGVPQFWTADGELRVWIDGMLAWEDVGLIFRTAPVRQRPIGWKGLDMYPILDLGVRSVMLNTYIGGTTPSTREHKHYYAGLAYGTQYIGPMKGI